MNERADRLFDLLPAVHRALDAEQGGPLRAILQVIAEQVDVVERDIDQLYDNWFIETCADWLIPYIGELIGYHPGASASDPDADDARAIAGGRLHSPRRDVANTIRSRRRKGTLALLESLAADIGGWPARAVESFPLLAGARPVNHPHRRRGRFVDLRRGDALEQIGSPFDLAAHTVDVRRPASPYTAGRFNIPDVTLYLWRLGVYSVMETPAHNVEEVGPHAFTFSVLGNDTPLYAAGHPVSADENDPLARPGPISRRALERHLRALYGPQRSLQIWTGRGREPVAAERIVAADLSSWRYRARPETVAVDPVLGRIAFPPRAAPRAGVAVSYHYSFSAAIGGGEYDRPLRGPSEHALALASIRPAEIRDPRGLADALGLRLPRRAEEPLRPGESEATAGAEAEGFSDVGREERATAVSAYLNDLLDDERLNEAEPFRETARAGLLAEYLAHEPRGWEARRANRLLLEAAYPEMLAPLFVTYRVGRRAPFQRISDALERWSEEQPRHAIVEIVESDVFTEQFGIEIAGARSLQIRAAAGARPVLRLLDYQADRIDALRIAGVAVEGEGGGHISLDGLLIADRGIQLEGSLVEVALRHCTLVPGWALHHDHAPRRPAEPSITLLNFEGALTVEHSIIGSIQSYQDEVRGEPTPVQVTDSILDATSAEIEAIHSPGSAAAHLRLTVQRSTVIGVVEVHAITLAEESIFTGLIRVARRSEGCMRFCSYLPEGSRTPRRYHCQPDVAAAALAESLPPALSAAERENVLRAERARTRPLFNSLRYGAAAYCQLAEACPPAISAGAEDESEIGVFHDLYQPQRLATLWARLDESVPAEMNAGIFLVS